MGREEGENQGPRRVGLGTRPEDHSADQPTPEL